MSFTGIFPKNINSKIPKGKLKLVRCKKCSLLQLEDNFDSNLMYGENYGYMSSLNKAMEFHLKLKSKYLLDNYKLKKRSFVLDIGSNDGTFLKFFRKSLRLFACDPTIRKFKKYYRKDIKLVPDFFSAERFKGLKFDLITSIAIILLMGILLSLVFIAPISLIKLLKINKNNFVFSMFFASFLTILELAKIISKKLNISENFIFKKLPQDDPLQRKPIILEAKDKLNWSPSVDLDQGLENTINYFKNL